MFRRQNYPVHTPDLHVNTPRSLSWSGPMTSDGQEEVRYARVRIDGKMRRCKVLSFSSEDDLAVVQVIPQDREPNSLPEYQVSTRAISRVDREQLVIQENYRTAVKRNSRLE